METFTVKCISSSKVVFSCEVETWADAIVTAHLVAEAYGHRTNVYKPGEEAHSYNAFYNR